MAAKESKKGSSTSEPGDLQDAEKSALGKATDISNRAYTPYEGERVAGMSQNEQAASNLARYGSDASRDMYGKAAGQLDSMQDYNSSNLEKYMNPYTEAVLQPQLRDLNTQYGTAKTQLLNSKAGALGGDRAAIQASQLDKQHLQAISDTTGKTYSDAFQSATQSFFNDQSRKMNAAQAYSAVGGDLSKLNTQQMQDLMATGGVSRALQQAGLDTKYSDFIENRDWDVNNLDPLLKAISASKGGNSTQTSTQKGSPWGAALGAASAVAGAYFNGGFGSNSQSAVTNQITSSNWGGQADSGISSQIGYPSAINVG